jgi:heat shock protein HslJ
MRNNVAEAIQKQNHSKQIFMKTLFQITGIIVLAIVAGSCKSATQSTKLKSEGITEKYWKLVEIGGKPVAASESAKREPHIILKNEGSRVNAHGGCNTLTGTYTLDAAARRIRFSQMASTQMACLHVEIENELKKVLEMADNYSLSDDGKYLSLNRARMAPLARFEVVYLQ